MTSYWSPAASVSYLSSPNMSNASNISAASMMPSSHLSHVFESPLAVLTSFFAQEDIDSNPHLFVFTPSPRGSDASDASEISATSTLLDATCLDFESSSRATSVSIQLDFESDEDFPFAQSEPGEPEPDAIGELAGGDMSF